MPVSVVSTHGSTVNTGSYLLRRGFAHIEPTMTLASALDRTGLPILQGTVVDGVEDPTASQHRQLWNQVQYNSEIPGLKPWPNIAVALARHSRLQHDLPTVLTEPVALCVGRRTLPAHTWAQLTQRARAVIDPLCDNSYVLTI